MKNKYYYTRKEVSKWLRDNKLLNHDEIDEILLKEKTVKRWIPKMCECYYFVNLGGIITKNVNLNGYDDSWYFKIGNCFLTREEAEKYKQKLINLGKEKRSKNKNEK